MKWEYKTIRYMEDYPEEDCYRKQKGMTWAEFVEVTLNELGSKGWELVSFEGMWIFKKPVKEDFGSYTF